MHKLPFVSLAVSALMPLRMSLVLMKYSGPTPADDTALQMIAVTLEVFQWISSSFHFCASLLVLQTQAFISQLNGTFAFTERLLSLFLGLGKTPFTLCLVQEWPDLNLSPLHVNAQGCSHPCSLCTFPITFFLQSVFDGYVWILWTASFFNSYFF